MNYISINLRITRI